MLSSPSSSRGCVHESILKQDDADGEALSDRPTHSPTQKSAQGFRG